MRKLFLIIIATLIFFSVSANDGGTPVKSRVIFKKNPSQSEIEGWEKDFFSNYEKEFADKERNDSDSAGPAVNGVTPPRKKVPILLRSVKPVPYEAEKEAESIGKGPEKTKEAEDAQNDKLLQQPEKTVEKQEPAVQEPVKENVAETVEQNDSDNEVDRSGQIRKMKELLKKRKGKSRIEDRRIY